MKVPLLDLKRIHEPIEPELKAAFAEVLESNYYIMGPKVQAFEAECSDYLKTSHSIGVSSGSDALILALMALDLKPGDEVICPSYTFFATAGAIWRLGAKPVFIDIDPKSYNLDPTLLEGLITDKTKAIIPVHLFGQTADMSPILEIARKYDLPVIEDAAQAIGAECHGQKAGSLSDMACFSFFPAKNLGAMGDGGLLTVATAELADKARVLRVHGSKPKYHHHLVGGNFRLDALQAALLSVKLPHLDAYAEARRQNAQRYFDAFDDQSFFALPHPQSDAFEHVYNQFVIRLKESAQRDALQAHLKERGIGSAIYYPIPLHLQACFAELGYKEGDLPVSEACAKETLALPIFPGMTLEEQNYVIAEIKAFFS